MNRTDIIFDFETIGANVFKCPAVDCAFATFSWERFLLNPYSFKNPPEVKKFKLSILDQYKNYGFTYEESDLEFWASKPKEVRDNLKPTSSDLTVSEFVDGVIEYLKDQPKISYWWSRSNTFDPIILQRLFHTQNKTSELNQYLKFWTVRDTRTHIDAKMNYSTNNGFVPVSNKDEWDLQFKAHDSSHDIIADIMRLQAIHRAEHDLEILTL